MKLVKHLTAIMLIGTCVSIACSSDSEDGTPGGGSGSGGIGAGGDTGAAGATGDAGSTSGDAGAGATNTQGGATGAAGAAGAAGSGPPDAGCLRFEEFCDNDADCCSNSCDMNTLTCASTVGTCRAGGGDCDGATDCCTLRCEGGTCSDEACISDNQECGGNAECCSGMCVDGSCEPLNTECSTAGNDCGANGDCCSQLCGDNEKCTLGASFCIQPGDVCIRNEDCCTGECTKGADDLVGTCAEPPSGSTFCTGVDGVVCSDCGDCCSRLCAPYGPTGVDVCQPVSGCHTTGDLCRSDADCCGGTVPENEEDRLPGWGNGRCQIEDGHLIGICRNPVNGAENPDGACSPQGNVCHLKDYVCSVSSARANCCADLGANGACQLDPLGVPRCYGLADCRMEGETCASTADCCPDGDGVHPPCVPDDQGVLRCGTADCVPIDGACTINGDCCPGGTCYRPAGALSGSCEPPTGEGGAGGGPSTVCSEYGQQCGDGCCNAVPCTDGICKYPPQ
jgi:hypothetical protein